MDFFGQSSISTASQAGFLFPSPLILIYFLLQCCVHPLWRRRERTCFSNTHRSQAPALDPGRAQSAARACKPSPAQPSPAQPSGSPAYLHMKRKWWILANYVLERDDESFSLGLSFSSLTPTPFHLINSDLISLLSSRFPPAF